MNKERQSLVSVGIPTYNRPKGLKHTLECILKQTYRNLEVVVSDNGSPSNETESIVKEYIQNDKRIRFFRQPQNMGMEWNFKFVLGKSLGDYFMWAADDDYYENNDLIEKLINHAPYYLLTFTNFNFVSPKKIILNYFTPIFKNCYKNLDYTNAFCRNGAGHPIYGMFNLNLLRQTGIELDFEKDLSYHLEGLLLHKIFSNGMVKYIDDAVINYNTKSREYESLVPVKRYKDFLIYTKRLFKFYLFNSDHSIKNKIRIIKLLFNCHYNHYKTLLKNKPKIKEIGKVIFLIRIINS